MYGFIDCYWGHYTVGMMARALCITPRSYYDYRKGICGKREAHRDDLERRIQSVYAQAYGRYGALRIAADIRAEGYQVSANTVSKYMKRMGLRSKLSRNAACKLNLFDALEIPKTTNGLVNALNLNKKNPANLLQALCNNDFLQCTNGKFSLTAKSKLLTENHPERLKYACMNWADEHLTAWQNLNYSIKTGNASLALRLRIFGFYEPLHAVIF